MYSTRTPGTEATDCESSVYPFDHRAECRLAQIGS